ncbi:MAG: hypothetical protein ACI8P0_002010 [Planctomycetaceae bacterium]|jgi:hypothetical protein
MGSALADTGKCCQWRGTCCAAMVTAHSVSLVSGTNLLQAFGLMKKLICLWVDSKESQSVCQAMPDRLGLRVKWTSRHFFRNGSRLSVQPAVVERPGRRFLDHHSARGSAFSPENDCGQQVVRRLRYVSVAHVEGVGTDTADFLRHQGRTSTSQQIERLLR